MKIFIQIASYRDPELIPTIKSCLENSKNPENLVFGIARQYHPDDMFDELSEYKKDNRFKILNIPYQESKGVCWARNQVQQLYDNEEYTLQIDSHMRFEKNWDEEMIRMIKQLQKKGYKKPLLTGYVSSYNPKNDPKGRVNVPWRMVFDKFIPEGAVFFLPETIPNWENLKEPVPSRFYSAHFCFTLGQFAKEVQHNPDFYFHGEEISIAVRAFTHGYDLFHPHKVLIWHEYTRNGRVKHWDDQKDWWVANNKAHDLNRKLFGMDGNEFMDQGEYSFGNERTLRDYEKYAGILFSKRSIQKYTLEKNYPPNPKDYKDDEDWLKTFTKKINKSFKVDKNKLKHNDYKFWAVIFNNSNGETIFREDINEENVKKLLSISTDTIEIRNNFESFEEPISWILWPYSEKNGWVDKIEEKFI